MRASFTRFPCETPVANHFRTFSRSEHTWATVPSPAEQTSISKPERGRPTSRGRGRHPVPDDEVDAGAIEREGLVSVAGGVELGAERLG